MLKSNLNEVEFTVFDTETTGLDPASGDRIVEIAAIRLKGEETIGTFQSLVNPGQKISQAAFEVNRISEEMLKDAPCPEEVFPEFMKFAEGSCLCSYNAGFDMGFLANELKLLNCSLPENMEVLDILIMARRLLPGLDRYRLESVAQSLSVEMNEKHRALADVKTSVALFKKFREMLSDKGIVLFKDALTLFGAASSATKDMAGQKISRMQEALDKKMKVMIKYLSVSTGRISERELIPK
ncbi:3'-5' exonuclease, partial [bacterium]